jgi:hypothetical protein
MHIPIRTRTPAVCSPLPAVCCRGRGKGGRSFDEGSTDDGASENIPGEHRAGADPGEMADLLDRSRQEFIAENAALDRNRRNIVFVGDSLTQGFKLKTYFPDLPVLNRGIVSDGGCDFPSGRSIYRGVTHRLDESIFNCNPSHLFY